MHEIYTRQTAIQKKSSSLTAVLFGVLGLSILASGLLVTIGTFGIWFYGIRDTPMRAFQSLVYLPMDRVFSEDHHIVKRIKSEAELEELYQTAKIWWVCATVATAACMLSISYHQVRALRQQGGACIAEFLGGIELEDRPIDAQYRKAVHVVDEMAIAAQMPRPRIFVLPSEDGVNAFATGNDVHDAALGLTEGAVRHLTREQLQAVAAHEFAHIANGDMQRNSKMIAYLHGIFVISKVSTKCLEVAKEMVFGGQGGGGDFFAPVVFGIPSLIFGIMLWPIGALGAALGSLAHAWISREREFLADAFAVEFTRNPKAVADALKQMGWHGSLISTPNVVECSHLFFGAGYRPTFGLLRSHPPLGARIVTLDKDWDGTITPNSAEVKPTAPALETVRV